MNSVKIKCMKLINLNVSRMGTAKKKKKIRNFSYSNYK
jgi:hypothetical protein